MIVSLRATENTLFPYPLNLTSFMWAFPADYWHIITKFIEGEVHFRYYLNCSRL